MYSYRSLSPNERNQLIQERLSRGFPPHSPPHPVQDAQYYLITAACLNHLPIMNTPERRKTTLDLLFEQAITHGVEILAWVILPNHYHLLVRLDQLSVMGQITQRVHGKTSRMWNQEDQREKRKIWYRFTDRAIRNESHYQVTLNYIHFNPVKHHWVESAYDWVESSLDWYSQSNGKEWLRDNWKRYPILEYGRGWDE